MADNQDKLTPSDQSKLAELEQQVSKQKAETASVKSEPKAESVKKQTTKSVSNKSDTLAKKATGSGAAKSNNNPQAKTGLLWFFTIINLLVLIGIVGAGYWTWQQWQIHNQKQADEQIAQQQSIAAQQQNIAATIAANQLVESNLSANNQVVQNSIRSLTEQLQLISSQVQSNQQNLADVSGRRPADWLLAEADYLVRMAGRKLWLEHDVKTAMMMLQSADSRIEDLDDPSLLPLRARLAEDLQVLQQVNQVSTSSVALALGAMFKQVDNLPLAFFKKPESAEVAENVTDSIDDWRSNLARNWREFTTNFFSVERVTTEIKPFMSQQQQWLSKEQLKLALQQAQFAALQENSALYKQSLQTAADLLLEFFDTEHASVIQFSTSLSNLLQTDFEHSYPEQFNAAPLLQDLIKQRLNSRFVNGSN